LSVYYATRYVQRIITNTKIMQTIQYPVIEFACVQPFARKWNY